MARTEALDYDPADYSDYFLERPTGEQLAVLKEGRLAPAADPLERGVVLAWDSPNLHSDALPPADYPRDPPEQSPHDPRPLFTSLLASNSPARGGTGWKLRLVEGIQTGEDQWSQVWRCKVVDKRGQDLVESVVLKLYQQSLFPFPPEHQDPNPATDVWTWFPARHLAEREAQAYRVLRGYQGGDLPLCYGFYRFYIPCGESVVGVVLEDLVDGTITMADYLSRETRGNRLTLDEVDELACSVYEAQHRFQDAGIIETNTDFHYILKFRDSSLLISLGFGMTTHRDMFLEHHELALRRLEARGKLTKWDLEWNWREMDQAYARMRFDELLHPFLSFREWIKMEQKRQRMPWLDLPIP
ncbi:hypothetical protein JCM10449v2_004699 [Rhodotorula kratochvilovae]